MRSFLFALSLHILGTLTFSISTHLTGSPSYISCEQHPVGRRATTYMVLWRCGQLPYFWWEQATTMPSFGDLWSQRRGQRGMMDPQFIFTNKRYGVTWQVPTPFLLYGNDQLLYKLLVVLRPSRGFFVGVWYA